LGILHIEGLANSMNSGLFPETWAKRGKTYSVKLLDQLMKRF
jgi:hypothetical protein